jgi:putative transposase
LHRPVESAQYTSIRLTERLAEAGIQPSVGAVGSSYGNALAETINGLYKWFNHHRLYEYCGDIPPIEMEAAHYAQAQRSAAG